MFGGMFDLFFLIMLLFRDIVYGYKLIVIFFICDIISDFFIDIN